MREKKNKRIFVRFEAGVIRCNFPSNFSRNLGRSNLLQVHVAMSVCNLLCFLKINVIIAESINALALLDKL